jgi:putative glutamine amidotransferase
MRSKRPKIGITQSATDLAPRYRRPTRYAFDFLKTEYHQSISDAGGIPLPLVNAFDLKVIKQYIDLIDGLMVIGGDDMDPSFFGQSPHKSIMLTSSRRDNFELKIIRLALKKNIPVFGICRGHQVINIALGGNIYQDLSCAPFKTLKHADPREIGNRFHKVKIEKGTILSGIIGAGTIEVNSSHHQIIDRIGKKLVASAYSSDSVIEALEDPDYRFLVAVQWHPEMISGRSHSKKLFRAFVAACGQK